MTGEAMATFNDLRIAVLKFFKARDRLARILACNNRPERERDLATMRDEIMRTVSRLPQTPAVVKFAVTLELNGADEARRIWPSVEAEHTTPAQIIADRGSVESRALAILVEHPEWTVSKIAAAVGCSRAHMYKMSRFVAARWQLKSGKSRFPRGTKDVRTGRVEASDD